MISKQKIKFISSLRLLKYRLQYNCFVAEGENVIGSFLEENFDLNSFFSVNAVLNFNQNFAFEIITHAELNKISSFKNPIDMLAVFKIPKRILDLNTVMQQKRIIILDSISDPGNLGSIIRTADWFGIKSIYLSKNCVDIFNSKVVQATMGSLARVKVYNVELINFLEIIKKNNIMCYGASLTGSNIYSFQKPNQCALIFGNEAHGISEKIHSFLDTQLLIPSNNNMIDSLNVAVAFGIILSEFR